MGRYFRRDFNFVVTLLLTEFFPLEILIFSACALIVAEYFDLDLSSWLSTSIFNTLRWYYRLLCQLKRLRS